MRRVVRNAVWFMLVGVVIFAPSLASAERNGVVELTRKAVTEFCTPVLEGGETPESVTSLLGISRKVEWKPAQAAWIKKFAPGEYYSFPLKHRVLSFETHAVSGIPSCGIVLFDVSPDETNRTFEALSMLLSSRGLIKTNKTSPSLEHFAEFVSLEGAVLVLLEGPAKDKNKYGPKIRLFMMQQAAVGIRF